MTKAIVNRLIQAALVAFMVGLISFVMTRSLPGDLAYRIAAGRYGFDVVDSAAAAKPVKTAIKPKSAPGKAPAKAAKAG